MRMEPVLCARWVRGGAATNSDDDAQLPKTRVPEEEGEIFVSSVRTELSMPASAVTADQVVRQDWDSREQSQRREWEPVPASRTEPREGGEVGLD